MSWIPSNQPVRYDRARVAQLKPVEAAIKSLGLPLIRFRKLNGILGALTMQIEDGGDHPEVNRLLIDALRVAVRHQVGEKMARPVLRALDAFEQTEAERWEQVKAGTLPPMQLTPEDQIDDLINEGYELLSGKQIAAACDRWLEAWELIKQLATPELRTVSALGKTYSDLPHSIFNCCQDLMFELHNAGINDPVYHEHRLRYIREFLVQFPDEDADVHATFLRAEGESFWYVI
jgi:hypothetical protein